MILTAFVVARCVSEKILSRNRIRLASVRLGEYDLVTEVDCENSECADPVDNIPIAEVIIHENYTAETHVDDIALIRLTRPVMFTDFINPICLPVAEHLRKKDFTGLPLLVTGFGIAENGLFQLIISFE